MDFTSHSCGVEAYVTTPYHHYLQSLLQSKREAMMFYPTDPSEMYGLFALRLGKYKAHYYTRGMRLVANLTT